MVMIYKLARVDFVKRSALPLCTAKNLYAPIGAKIIDFKKLSNMNISLLEEPFNF